MKQVVFLKKHCNKCPANCFYDCLVANCCLKDDFHCSKWLFDWYKFVQELDEKKHGYIQLKLF